MDLSDPHKILGVPQSASADQLRRAFRRAALRLHPDIKGHDAKSTERFKRIVRAYRTLRARLAEADKTGKHTPARQPNVIISPRTGWREAPRPKSGSIVRAGGFEDIWPRHATAASVSTAAVVAFLLTLLGMWSNPEIAETRASTAPTGTHVFAIPFQVSGADAELHQRLFDAALQHGE